MKVFGMVTTADSDEYTGHALASFFRHTELGPSDRFILYDNDRSFAARGTLRDYPRVELVGNKSPRSFAANINAGLAEARSSGADLFFLNNDIIFSANWLPPLLDYRDAIVLPVSNVEFSYQAGALHLRPAMDLQDYLGNERYFEAIAASHSRNQFGFRPGTRPAYFCVRIPCAVYEVVGNFDEGFGPGGAEDTDYSIRACLAGFSVGHVLNSFLLHFHGKSTWRGAETPEETQARNERYVAAFREKWGEAITRLVLLSDDGVLEDQPALSRAWREGDARSVIRALQSV